MGNQKKTSDNIIWLLQERVKELNCLYEIEELMNKPDVDLEDVCNGIIAVIPLGWKHPEICVVKIIIEDKEYSSVAFKETPWMQSSKILVHGKSIGRISVYYTEEMPKEDEGPFLKEETKLLQTIVDRLGHFILHKRMKKAFQTYETDREDLSENKAKEWQIALNLLQQTDRNLFIKISRQMLNRLRWTGIKEAEQLLSSFNRGQIIEDEELLGDENKPRQKSSLEFNKNLCEKIFKIASKYFSDDQMLTFIKKWMQDDRLSFLIQVSSRNLSLAEVINALRRYHHMVPEGIELSPPSKREVQVSLIRRFLSEQLQYISKAKEFIEIKDFFDILDNIIFSADSHGKLGGKSAGLFLAEKIIKKLGSPSNYLDNIKVPKTWYITSDILLNFLNYNNLNEVIEQKYKNVSQVRLEYPNIVQTFKSCRFPPEIVLGLSAVLDDFKECPLIVRSSSLLEDRFGAAFSGKYKSLFLANRGSKQKRLDALTDAIAEVYASTFGPDPIEYRSKKGMLDDNEEMGIMIQEVVGKKVGDYFVPVLAGVAFSRNEFRWSPRIKQEDGLLRLVPGLGTRAVDRTSDDYPVLIAPGQKNLRVNVTVDEIIRYSPKKIDVINLKLNTFETVRINEFLKKLGDEVPNINQIVSILDGQHIRKPLGMNIDFDKEDFIITFEGLITDTKLVTKIKNMLKLLQDKMGTPVNIEFAYDGKDLFLLQCRPQSYLENSISTPIPRGIPKEKIIFSAKRYISNGKVPDCTHIVYVDPESYDKLSNQLDLLAVGRAIGCLNRLLPKRRFILMGPGRWGSRGDIKLGVRVTYADISNTAVLIEIARKKGNYLPDLSFGTHFFQDLVEAEIRYLPLYPDDKDIIFNERFFKESNNILPDVLPEFSFLADTIRLIDIPKNSDGYLLRVLMNADLEEAVAVLVKESSGAKSLASAIDYREKTSDNFWAWRLKMAEYIASQLDPKRFGVKGFYVFGSTKNATAGPCSDIDILIHFRGMPKQRKELMFWFEGWSLCLDEMNYLQTGYKTGGLLDVHIVTDEDISKKTSYAVKIGAVTNAARPLQMKKA